MNVLVLNRQSQLQSLEVDIIKSVTGSFDAREIIDMFKNFFYNKMILDVTALKGYNLPNTYKILAEGLNPDKIIFFLPEGSDLCTSGFLSRIIDYGIYNFTTNLDGVKYLINKSNSYRDVEHIQRIADKENTSTDNYVSNNYEDNNFNQNININASPVKHSGGPIIVGFQNVTSNAGATSLIYMLKRELSSVYGNKVIALELDKNDFLSFGDKRMISTTSDEVRSLLMRLGSASIILIDLNDSLMKDMCSSIIYLIEPSTIKLNTLMRRNRNIIGSLKDKDVILNKSLLSEKDISEFEYESGIKVLYNMPPLNDRKRNAVIVDFLKKVRLLKDGNGILGGNRIFGLFRK